MTAFLLLALAALLERPGGSRQVEAERLVKALAEDDFFVRERASRRLLTLGKAGHRALLAASDHRDHEVRRRSRQLLEESFWPRPSHSGWRAQGQYPRLHALCGPITWRKVTEKHYHPWADVLHYGCGEYMDWEHLPPTGPRLDWCYRLGEQALQSRGIDQGDYYPGGLTPLCDLAQEDACRTLFYQLRVAGVPRWALELLLDVMVRIEERRDH